MISPPLAPAWVRSLRGWCTSWPSNDVEHPAISGSVRILYAAGIDDPCGVDENVEAAETTAASR